MTILSESTVKIFTTYGCIGLLFMLVFCIIAIYFAHADSVIPGLILIGLAIVIFVLVIVYGTEFHKRIKAIIEDDYPFVKLYEEYDVEERDGDIWVLTGKEPIKEGK